MNTSPPPAPPDAPAPSAHEAPGTRALLETQAMLAAIGRIQAQLLTRKDAQAAFDALLEELLRASGSPLGFIGEVRHDEAGAPWVRIHTISDIAWDEASRALVRGRSGAGLEFRRLDTLVGAVLREARVVIANDPAHDPRRGGVPAGHPPIEAFLGIPFVHRDEPIGVVGLANRPGGYTQDVVELLQPVVDTVRTVVVAYRAERSRVRAEAAVIRLNRRLELTVARLERVNQLNRLLSEMRDQLQASPSIAAICAVGEAFCGALLGATGGCIALTAPGGARAPGDSPGAPGSGEEHPAASPQLVHGWGSLPPQACHEPPGARPSIDATARTLSAPLVAQGEDAERLRLAGILAMHLAMAISNMRLRDTLRAQAIRDPLTGLYNRRYMDEVLEREVRRTLRSEGALAVFMVDIDHFKRINDGFGHDIGDRVIRALAHCLAGAIRHEDYAFRYGGEEFLLLMPGVEAAAMPARAQTLLEAVRRLDLSGAGVPLGGITVSIGAAALPEHGRLPADLVRAADEAMYRAKQGGRDRAVCA